MTDEKKPEEGAKAGPKAAEKPAAKPAAPEPRDDDPGDEATPDGSNEPDKPKRPNWAQRRIDELTKARREAERRAERAERVIFERLQQQHQQPQAQPQAQATTKPQAAQFQTTEDYLEALAEWKADQKYEERDRRRREEAEKQEREQRVRKVHQSFAEREEKARAKYEDFEEVAYSDGTPISELMAEVIRRSELGPDIAYYIGKNPDKGLQIAQMTDPASVALALGRIEAQLEAAATPPAAVATTPAPKAAPTAAPPPPKTLSGSAPVQKDPEQMTTKEWMAWRESQIKKKRA